MAQFQALSVRQPFDELKNSCVIACTGKSVRLPSKQRLRNDPGYTQRDLVGDWQVMSRADICPACLVATTVDVNCDLAHGQTELTGHYDVSGFRGTRRPAAYRWPSSRVMIHLALKSAIASSRLAA
jgi:hypothetical protein